MDLYRVLRISIYLLVASGAFAICVAEGSPAFLVGVFAFGGLAYLTVDSRRMKPVRMEFASAMALALLIYTLLPLREDNGWDRFPAAFAHFLCALQVLLFFTAFRGPMLLLFCGATLAVVVISGVMQPSITLLGRLICFITVTSWTLFIHSLWRARESFQTRTTTQPGDTRSAEKVLSERAFWQELALTGGMSATCIVIGALLYFTAPRLDRLSGIIRPLTAPPKTEKKHSGAGNGFEDEATQTDPPIETGESTEIQLRIHQQINQNFKNAFKVKFSGLPADLTDANGRLLFKTGAFAVYRDGTWAESKSSPAKEPEKGILDPSVSGTVYKGPELKESIEECSAGIHAIGTVGPIVRVEHVNAQTGPTGVTIDDEGSLSTSNKETLQSADVFVTLPPHEKDLPAKPLAIHNNINRYVLQTGLDPELEPRFRSLANAITAKCGKEDYLAKVQAIVAYLRNPEHAAYTLDLRKVIPAREPMERFLLSDMKEQRVGHCAYFASAFVLLCRFNNIPARMAKGFAVDLPKNSSNEITFRHSNAHSWGEVYFKDVGWVAFDPTPHDPNAPDLAMTPPPVSPSPTFPAAGPTDKKSNQGLIEGSWDRFINFSSNDQRDAIDWVSQELGTPGAALGGSMGWIEASIAWTIVLSMLGAIVYLFMRRGGRRLPLIFGGPRKSRAAVAFYNDLLQVLSRRGFVRRPGQTPREFAEFVVKRGGASFQPVLVVTEIFESVRYGNVDVSQDEFNALQKSLDNLRELTFGAGPKG